MPKKQATITPETVLSPNELETLQEKLASFEPEPGDGDRDAIREEVERERQLSELPVETRISMAPTIQQIIMVFRKGKDFSNTKFPAHTQLITLMRGAWHRGEQDAFVTLVDTYFIQAEKLLPNIPGSKKRLRICLELHGLIEQFTLYEVGRKLISGMG